jgi:hypothetical protein
VSKTVLTQFGRALTQLGIEHIAAYFVRCLPAKRLMRARSVVPVEERGETPLLLESIGRRAQTDPLVLHRPAQTLDKDVVVATTAPIHADLDAMIQQHPGERLTGELRPLIGIEHRDRSARCPLDNSDAATSPDRTHICVGRTAVTDL